MLLRAGVEFFSNWGMELLVTQLHDHSKAVSMEALDILDEACEDKVGECWRGLTMSRGLGNGRMRGMEWMLYFVVLNGSIMFYCVAPG